MADRPDIVVVLSDQQRPDSCGVYGQRLAVTPVLDALAGKGVTFDAAFTPQPVCGPARAALQTGRMPTAVGCWRNGLALAEGTDTLATRLTSLGYRTGYVGKWHLGSDIGWVRGRGRPRADYGAAPVPPGRRGGYRDVWLAADLLERTSEPYRGHVFDADGRPVPLIGYRADAVTDLALEALARLGGGRKPYLLFVSHLEPHHQNSRMRSVGPRGWARRFAGYDVPGDLAGRFGDWRWNYPEYLACCASIDANLGRLLAAVDAAARPGGTLVVYTSDHGSHFRTRNLEYKRTCHDASIRVPLVLRGPGFEGGRRSGSLVSHLDLVPTLVRAAGGADPHLHGRPLQDVLASAGGAGGHDAVVVQISESQIGRCLRTPTHTYAVRAPGLGRFGGHLRSRADRYVDDKLYDLANDPHQRRNLVSAPGTLDLRRALAARLVHEIERVEGHRPAIVHR